MINLLFVLRYIQAEHLQTDRAAVGKTVLPAGRGHCRVILIKEKEKGANLATIATCQ